MGKAFMRDPSNARVLMALDQLYKRLYTSYKVRLSLLEKSLNLVESRDDLCLERSPLFNLSGQYENNADELFG